MSTSKAYKVSQLPSFEKEASKIISTYPGFKNDLISFKNSIAENPEQGNHLGSGVYKVRIEITGKPAGKRYGARIIYAIFSITTDVLLLKVYDKSVTKDLSREELNAIRTLVREIRTSQKK